MAIPNLIKDMHYHPDIAELISDKSFADELYAAFCNVEWQKVYKGEDGCVARLKGPPVEPWGMSWRYAADVVANLRNIHMDESPNESYINYYIDLDDKKIVKLGVVTDRIAQFMWDIGWVVFYPVDELHIDDE